MLRLRPVFAEPRTIHYRQSPHKFAMAIRRTIFQYATKCTTCNILLHARPRVGSMVGHDSSANNHEAHQRFIYQLSDMDKIYNETFVTQVCTWDSRFNYMIHTPTSQHLYAVLRGLKHPKPVNAKSSWEVAAARYAQYFIAYKPCIATNHNRLVRLLCLLEVVLCLVMAAKHILVFQTSPKIVCAFKRKCSGSKPSNHSKMRGATAALTVPITLVPCYNSPGSRCFRVFAPSGWRPLGVHRPLRVVAM